jgi:inorganic pyrophosphatase
MDNDKFWSSLDRLVNESEIEIDRPKGTAHPKHNNLVFPVDYGYLKGTKSPDNAGIDVFIGSMENPMIDAIICTVDLGKKDSEIKILIGCNESEKEAVFKIYSEDCEALQGILIRRS